MDNLENFTGPYRLDYIGEGVYELDKNYYRKVTKTGCIYVFPAGLKINSDGMISNFETYDGSPIRIRWFNDYIGIEPVGIKIPKENITFVPWSRLNKVIYVSSNNSEEAREVCIDSFFGNCCERSKNGIRFDTAIYNYNKGLILNNLKNDYSSKTLSMFNFATLFCYHLLCNGINKIDIDEINGYIYELLINKKTIIDKNNLFCQFTSLMYMGVLYPDYERVGQILPKTFFDYTDDKGNMHCHQNEVLIDGYRNLIIDDSNIVIKFFKEKYELNKEHYVEVEDFAKPYIDFHNSLINNSSKIKKL